MKKLPVFIAILLVALVAYSMTQWSKTNSSVAPGIVGSKNITTETRNVDDFTKLEVDGAFQVDVTYSSNESVSVEAPDNLQDQIDLDVKSGTLKITTKNNRSINSQCALKIHIKTANLNEFKLSGASSVTLNNSLKDNSFKIESTGAASFKGEIDVENADIELTGASTVALNGKANTGVFNLTGASQVKDYDFDVKNLKLELSGASSATISSSGEISGDISGASSLNYKGNPNVKSLNKSGAASARNH